MSGGESEQLIKMANDIANYFHSEPDHDAAVAGIVNHIQKFWEPRMRKKILAYFADHDGEGLNDLARAAIARLAAATLVNKSATPINK